MSTIDERIVAMKFNNGEFKKRITDTLESLADLKKGLNMESAGRNLQSLTDAAKNLSFQPLMTEIDRLSGKFEGLQAIATGALLSIGNKLMDLAFTGAQKLGENLTQAARDGFSEYELQINSVQTILSNTAQHGTGIEDVNAALAELNEYADKTIYNFAAMTKNIGTFTVAGIKLEDATASVKGFSNMAALAGADATSAAGAMYQLSQAMSSGVVRLQDWISIERAGIAGVQFQDALVETARAHGIAVDQMIADNGSFRNSLAENWLTAEVMTQTLTAMTGDLNKEQLMSLGYSEEQAIKMQDLAKRAMESATVVKTFTQLVETYGEAVGSGWAQSWQIIIGDFEEAKVLFTEFSEMLNDWAGASAAARNEQLTIWKEMGGREALVDALRNAWKALQSVLEPIAKAMREVFPPQLGKTLAQISFFIRDLTKGMILSADAQKVVYAVFKTFFQIIKFGITVIGGFFGIISKLIGALFSGGEGMGELGSQVVKWMTWIGDAVSNLSWVEGFFSGLGDVLANIVGFFKDVAVSVALMVASFAGFAVEGTEVAFTRLRERLEQFGKIGEWAVGVWERFKSAFERVANFFKPITDALGNMFGDIGQNIYEAFSDVDFHAVLDLINVGLLGAIAFMIKKFMDGGIWSLFGKGAKEGLVDSLKGITGDFRGILTGVTDTLETMQASLKADILMKIATAIALLAAAVLVLSLIDSEALTKALTALTIMFVQLAGSMAIFGKIAAGGGIAQLPAMGIGLILIAIAINILVAAVARLGQLEWEELIKGLIGVTALLLAMGGAVKLMQGNAGGMIATGLGLIAIAFAVKILASAVADMAQLSWGEMIKGLVGVGVVLGGLLLFNRLSVANKGAIGTGVGLILLATALKILASAVGAFATMDVGALTQGIGAMGIVLGVLAVFMKTTANVGQMISFAAGMIVMGYAMKVMASAIADLGAIKPEELERGLIGLAVALGAIAVSMLLMPQNMLMTSVALVVVAAALKIIASVLTDMGGMSWEEIGRGLVVLAGSLLIIAGALYLMTGALPGAAALLVVAGALALIGPVLKMLGKMSWEEIGRGLVALAGAFGVIGVAGLVLAPLVPVLLLLGAAITLIGAGLALVGVGVLGFALGLTVLAAAGLAALPIVTALVMGILALIPIAMEQLGKGIVAFAGVIGDSAPVFVEAAVKLITALLDGIDEVVPRVIDTLLLLIEELIEAIVEAVPMFVDGGMRLITGILDGIANNIEELARAGKDVIIEFLTALDENMPDIIDKAGETVVKFVDGIAQGVDNNAQDFVKAGSKLFRAIVNGVSMAIEQGGADLAWAGQRIGQAIINGTMNALQINSPSKVFRDYIMGSVFEGVEDGGDKGERRARTVGEDIGSTLVAGVSSTIATLAQAVQGDLDMDPTIRPVLDLTQFSKDASRMGGMMNSPVIRPDTAAARAQTVQAAVDSNPALDVLPPVQKITNVEFKQENHSPKALTTAEIYRQTNNQVNQVKSILEDIDA